MSSEWGRIDEDGTVYVRTADGERAIGSWQAGDPEAGLAFYPLRYEDLATEVRLLEKRLESGAGDPASTRSHVRAMKEQLPTAAVIGDLAALDARLDALLAAAEAKAGEAAAARDKARADAVAAKEALVAEAEKIAESGTSWKASGDRLRTHRRGVAPDQGHRPQDRRRAVEALRRRARRVRPAPRPALRPARRRARHGQAGQGAADQARRGAVDVLRLEGDRRRRCAT